jgi:alcohol dehydrogenase
MAIADQVFGFFMPVVNLMGPGSVKEVGVQAKSLGLKKALIVTDAGLEKMGVADQVKEIIEAAGLKVIVLPVRNPTRPILMSMTAWPYLKKINAI